MMNAKLVKVEEKEKRWVANGNWVDASLSSFINKGEFFCSEIRKEKKREREIRREKVPKLENIINVSKWEYGKMHGQ